jgi:gamma-glutamyltranspeptidase
MAKKVGMTKAKALSGALLAMIACIACKDNASVQVKAREEIEIAEAQAGASVAISEAAQAMAVASAARQRTVNDERLGLGAMPESYLKTSNVKSNDRAAPGHRLQLVSLAVTNTSHFSVGDLRGEVTWTDAKGVTVGSSPLAFTGSISPGETKTFSTAAGSLVSPAKVEGPATPSSVSFTHVRLLD